MMKFPSNPNYNSIFQIVIILIILIMAVTGSFLSGVFGYYDLTGMRKAFVDSEIVPKVINVAPKRILQVTYQKNVDVSLGNRLDSSIIRHKPTRMEWDADPKKFYTLLMIDADAPCHKAPFLRSWWHWGVVNIQGKDLSTGEVLADYIGAGPRMRTGYHRYIFLLYQQRKRGNFDNITKADNM